MFVKELSEDNISPRVIYFKRWEFKNTNGELPNTIHLTKKALEFLNTSIRWFHEHERQKEEESCIRPDLMPAYTPPPPLDFNCTMFGMKLVEIEGCYWHLSITKTMDK